MGGGRLHDAQPVHILYCYTYTSNEWSKRIIAPHPTHATPKSRCAFGLVQVGRDVYICGGQFYRVNVSLPEILNDIWHFSLDSFQWTKLSVSLPERMYFHRVAVSPSKHLYVYGGVLESGKRSSRLYRYQLPHQVPELREMCWCTITSLWRDLHRADPTELLENYGIPQKFIDRLQGWGRCCCCCCCCCLLEDYGIPQKFIDRLQGWGRCCCCCCCCCLLEDYGIPQKFIDGLQGWGRCCCCCCLVVACVPNDMLVYFRDGSALTVVHVTGQFWKFWNWLARSQYTMAGRGNTFDPLVQGPE